VPIGIGTGFLGWPSVAVAVESDSGVFGGGRQMMQPTKHVSRNSRKLFAPAEPCGTGTKGVEF
jgi:hypothetical protein